MSEFINVCLTKNLLSLDKLILLSDKFMDALKFSLVNKTTIKKSLQVKKIYHYSYWDSLIIASALESNCSILYTEDMHEGQVIDGKLKIVNPFKILADN